MPLQQPRNKNWQNGSNGTALTRVSKGEGSERHNPQKEPKASLLGGRLISWTLNHLREWTSVHSFSSPGFFSPMPS